MVRSDRFSSETVAVIGNALLFQIAWFVNVTEGGWIPALTTAAVVSIHLGIVYRIFRLAAGVRECVWLVMVAGLGLLAECVFVYFDVLQHQPQSLSLFGIPDWLLFLWLIFATTFRFSLSFLRGRPALSILLGACAALSYWGGAALNATSQLASPAWISLLWIALIWALLLPTLVMIHRRYIV